MTLQAQPDEQTILLLDMRDSGTNHTLPEHREHPRYNCDNQRSPFDEAVGQTLK